MLKKQVEITKERILSSFDINDLLENRSYIKFYAARAGTSGDVLTSQQLLSSSVRTASTSNFEINFDATFQAPALIQGIAYFKMAVALEGPGGAPQRNGTPTLRLLKYSGGVETELCSALDWPDTSATTGTVTDTLMMATLTKTAFKIGDILRLEMIMTVSGSTNGTPYVFHSPDTRTTSTYDGVRPTSPDTSSLVVWVPFIPNL
jgi:hypothetical protein